MLLNITESHVDYLYDYFKGGIELPIKSNGFNMSFTKFKKKYIFVIRFVFPLKNIIEKKELVPGISKSSIKRFVEKTKEYLLENSNISEDYIWSWQNFYQSNILFVGTINDKLEIKIDKNIKPYASVNPLFCLQQKSDVDVNGTNSTTDCSYYFNNMEDFRLYTFNGRIYMINSTMNVINQIFVTEKGLKIFTKFRNICNPVLDVKKPLLVDNGNYLKIYEKNWSLYKVLFKDNKEQSFSFLHDFSKEGIEGVDYNPITGKCRKRILVPYKNTFPINSNIARFSFGSTCVHVKSNFQNKTKTGYLGVGHLKLRLFKEGEKTKVEKHFHKLFLRMHKYYKKIFKKKYKPHHVSQYYLFFFLYDDVNSKFYISDIQLPVPYYKYYFNMVFPMSIVKDSDDLLISMGYGDYTNLLLRIPEKDVLSSIKYDVSDLDVTDLKLNLLFN